MKKIKQVFALLLALVLTAGILPVAAASTGFHDVPEGAYYADAGHRKRGSPWALETALFNRRVPSPVEKR